MYRNLEAEMARNKVTRRNLADTLGVRYATVIEKLNGKYPFKLDEAFAIKQNFFPNLSMEYLFESDEVNSNKRQKSTEREVS